MKQINSESRIEDLRKWCSNNAPSILQNYSLNDKNDLNIFKKFYINSGFTNQCEETKFFNKAKEMGML